MPQTKHKIFKLKITDDGKFSFDVAIEKEINDFLFEPNNIYINHSITILSEDIEKYGLSKTVNRFIVISLIYKDLNATSLDVKNSSKKVQKIVANEIEKGAKIKEPLTDTDLDKEVRKFTGIPKK